MGINGLNPSDAVVATFDLLAVLDTTTVRQQITGYQSAKINFDLKQKINGAYGDSLDLNTYITAIKIGDTTLTASQIENGEVVIPLSALDDNGAYITIPIITVTVKRGQAMSDNNLLYTNYMLTVAVTLLNGNSDIISSSHASNHIVYTNANVVPDFIDR